MVAIPPWPVILRVVTSQPASQSRRETLIIAANVPVITVTRRLPVPVEERLRRDYRPHFNETDASYDPDTLIRRCQGANGLLCTAVDRLPAGLIFRLPGTIRIIATYSVGVDHIDLEAAADRSIIVTNTPDVLTEATADVAMLCLLGAARRAFEGDRLIREGRWEGWRPTQLLGVELRGRRLGIVGMGRIGQAVARRAMGFGLRVLYHDRGPVDWPGPGDVEYVEKLDDLLPRSEFLSLHVPATPETHHLLDARRLARLPRGAVVVNTARGGLVDDEALISALRRGKVRAAGLDVFANEPHLHWAYRELPNVFLLPHLGSATEDTRNAMGFRALDNLDAYFAGEEPGDVVHP